MPFRSSERLLGVGKLRYVHPVCCSGRGKSGAVGKLQDRRTFADIAHDGGVVAMQAVESSSGSSNMSVWARPKVDYINI